MSTLLLVAGLVMISWLQRKHQSTPFQVDYVSGCGGNVETREVQPNPSDGGFLSN